MEFSWWKKRLGLTSWNCLRNWWAGGTAPGCFAFDCSSHEFLVNQMFGPVFGSSQDLQRNTTCNRNTGGELTDTPFGTTCAWCQGTQTLFWARNKKCYPKKQKNEDTRKLILGPKMPYIWIEIGGAKVKNLVRSLVFFFFLWVILVSLLVVLLLAFWQFCALPDCFVSCLAELWDFAFCPGATLLTL